MSKTKRKNTKRALKRKYLVSTTEEKSKGIRGKPKAFNSPEELQELIDEYFIYCDENKIHYGIVGMCTYINIVRNTLCEYEKKPEFKDTIKMAKQRVESYNEQLLLNKANPTGVIFNLKANFGYVDKTEIKAEVKQEVKLTVESLLSDDAIDL